MKKFRGFTLTELMIALAVIGVLVAVVTPAIMKTRPNKNKMMVKKTFYTTEQIVSSLINDERLYPDMTEACENPEGVEETENFYCAWGFDYKSEAKYEGETYTGDTKFRDLFKSKLNISKDKIDNNESKFMTTDGVIWDLTNTTGGAPSNGWTARSTTVSGAGTGSILIDVNGDDAPNAREADSDADDFDQYVIEIKANGKMNIANADQRAAEYITINTSIRDALQ